MSRICVVTSEASAYYGLVRRLKTARLAFSSALPGSDLRDCGLVLTTAAEATQFSGKKMVLEGLDENPGIFKGQVLSCLGDDEDVLLVGVDPGKRTGLAVFYGQTELGFYTLDSSAAICSTVSAFVQGIPGRRLLVRIGNGNRLMAARLVDDLRREVSGATIELVNESGTSVGSSKIKGIQRDEVAAAKIAFRKGEVVNPGTTRTRG